MHTTLSRRRFLTATAPLILPGRIFGQGGATSPNNKVRLACIGVGGQGTGNLNAFLTDERVQVVAVCDVDATHRAKAAALAKLKDAQDRVAADKPARLFEVDREAEAGLKH